MPHAQTVQRHDRRFAILATTETSASPEVWDGPSRERLHVLSDPTLQSAMEASFSDDERSVVVCGSGRSVVWDVATGERIVAFDRVMGVTGASGLFVRRSLHRVR